LNILWKAKTKPIEWRAHTKKNARAIKINALARSINIKRLKMIKNVIDTINIMSGITLFIISMFILLFENPDAKGKEKDDKRFEK